GCRPTCPSGGRRRRTPNTSRRAGRGGRGTDAMPTTDTAAALQQAAAGLTYPSETDAPWTAFAWPDAAGPPTGEEVRRRGRHKSDAPVEERSVDELFAPLVQEQAWSGVEEKAD